jgi:hypothetical protein
MGVVGRLDQYASMLATEFDETTANTPSITGLGTYYASEFNENVGITTALDANIFPPYDLVYDDFGGTLFGAGQGRYMRQNTDKSVIVYNEIDEISDFRDIVRSGLVLDLDAGMNASYVGSGTNWTDLSPYGNNGTLTNGPTYSSANGGSLVFDGTNDYASIAHSDSLSLPTALTLSIWFYSGTAPENIAYLKGRTDADNYNPYLTFSGVYGWTGPNGRAFYTPSAGFIQNNTWYNLVVSHTSGNTPNVYRNGVLSTSYTFTEGDGTRALGTNTNQVGINADIPRGTIGSFNGRVASIQLYNRALTAAEISQNYNALRNRYGL